MPGSIGIISMLILILMISSNLALLPLANAGGSKNHRLGLGNRLSIPNDLITPPNQKFPLPSNAIKGSDIPKNLISGPSCASSCPLIIGTNKDDIINGVSVTDSIIYGLNGDDVITGGSGATKLYGGDGNDAINGGAGNALIIGGEGDDVLFGGTGTNTLVGGPGNDQLYAGASSDTLIGGPGADYFNCGANTRAGGTSQSALVLDFNPSEGDTKATNCIYVFTQGGAPATP
ncbi:MAG: calcium-binding protein [Nitrososphaeraceae archaeon]